MPKKNLYLVQPNFGIGEGKYAGYWIPYSIGTLWTYCKQFKDISEQYEMCGLLFKRDDIPMLVKSLNDPSIIAFSNYIWNWNYNRTLAKAVKNAFPKALIVFGGPQITNRSQNFFKENPFVDIMVHAEGEETFVEILRENLNEDADFRKINGCSIRLEDCSALKTDLRPRLEIENHPSPYAEGVFDQIIKENAIVLNKAKNLNLIGLRGKDALHISCAISAGCKYFLTTDDKILNKNDSVTELVLTDPIGFVKEVYQ